MRSAPVSPMTSSSWASAAALVPGCHREVVKRDAVGSGQLTEVIVVGHHADDIDGQRTRLPAEQQVVQAVAEPGDHDQGADPHRPVVQLPGHVERLGHPGKAALEVGQRPARRRQAEVHPHEEPAVRALPVLLAGQDVRRMLDEEAGHRVHDPGLVRARQREHILPTRIRAHRPPHVLHIAQLISLYATIMRLRLVSGQADPGASMIVDQNTRDRGCSAHDDDRPR